MKKPLFLVVMAIVLAFGLTACGSSSTSSTSKTTTTKTTPAIVGAWECVSVDLDGSGEYMDADKYKELTSLDIKDFMSFQAWDNGQAMLTMNMSSDDAATADASMLLLKWTESNGAFELTTDETTENISCKIGDDKQLTLEITSSSIKMSVKFNRTGDPDMTSIYSLNFNYSNERTQTMSALMQGGYYVVDDNTVYGYYKGDKLAKVEIKKDGTSPTKVSESVLKDDRSAGSLTKKDDTLYYIALDGKTGTGIYSMNLSTNKETELIKGEVDYLNVTDNYLFYTDSTGSIYRADLSGKNATKVCEDEAYYVYSLSDNFLLYQDDANSETLVVYNIATKQKINVSPARSYNPVIADGYLYYTTESNGSKYMGRTNLTTGAMETGDYGLTYSPFMISNGKIYFDDGFSVSIDKWNQLTGNRPAAYISIAFEWADENYLIEEGFGAYNLYCTDGGDGYVAMMTNEDWAKISQ